MYPPFSSEVLSMPWAMPFTLLVLLKDAANSCGDYAGRVFLQQNLGGCTTSPSQGSDYGSGAM